jgi:hypothetical protein
METQLLVLIPEDLTDVSIETDVQDSTANHMEELSISKVDSVDVSGSFSADLVLEQEKLEQERLLKECEDKKKSLDLAQELQAK